MKKVYWVISGGQTGVDRAALDVAKSLRIRTAGWCPREDRKEPTGLLKLYPELRETPLGDARQCAEWNVRDSHATMIIKPKYCKSEGTLIANNIAIILKRPILVVSVDEDVTSVVTWIQNIGDEITLNIAGPNESEWPGIYDEASNFIQQVLRWFV
jgi:hypothetical protein